MRRYGLGPNAAEVSPCNRPPSPLATNGPNLVAECFAFLREPGFSRRQRTWTRSLRSILRISSTIVTVGLAGCARLFGRMMASLVLPIFGTEDGTGLAR